MNNLKKNKIIVSLMGLTFISTCFLGCTKTKGYKTVILQDENKSQFEDTEKNEDTSIEINKIYKYDAYDAYGLTDETNTQEVWMGWKDNENILGLCISGEGDKFALNEINYKFGFKKNILTTQDSMSDISPNGEFIIYIKRNYENKIYIKNITTGEEKVMIDTKLKFGGFNSKVWSQNGKYVTFLDEIDTDTTVLYVYDVYSNTLKKDIIYKKYNHHIQCSSISNDGSKVALVDYGGERDVFMLNLVYLNESEIEDYKNNQISITNNDTTRFIEDDKIVFIKDKDNTLCIYDIKTKDIVKLDNDVMKFNISKDSKYIAYEKYTKQEGNDIFAMELDKMEVKKQRLVYKGFESTRIFWSEDNKKILLAGVVKDPNKEKYILEGHNEVKKQNYKYLILEFK